MFPPITHLYQRLLPLTVISSAPLANKLRSQQNPEVGTSPFLTLDANVGIKENRDRHI